MPTQANPIGEAVLDLHTGLVWEAAPGEFDGLPGISQFDRLNQPDARTACLLKFTGEVRGWRLPSIHELGSLMSAGDWHITIDELSPFSDIDESYWSATSDALNRINAWLVNFENGTAGPDNRVGLHWVWCVRGGGPITEY